MCNTFYVKICSLVLKNNSLSSNVLLLNIFSYWFIKLIINQLRNVQMIIYIKIIFTSINYFPFFIIIKKLHVYCTYYIIIYILTVLILLEYYTLNNMQILFQIIQHQQNLMQLHLKYFHT